MPAFSHGTMTVMSLCRILIVRYSRFSPSTSFCSFLQDLARPVMRIYDVVTDLVIDVGDLTGDLEVRDLLLHRCFR